MNPSTADSKKNTEPNQVWESLKLVVQQDAKKKAKLSQKERVEEKKADLAPAPKILYQATILTVQERLSELSYKPGSVDGKWGKKTGAALKQFQQDEGLNASGKLDEETEKKLGL